MGSFLDFVLGCITFVCIAVAFRKIALHCFPIIEKARVSSREGIPHPERFEMAAFLAFNLLLGSAGATLFYRGLFWLSDPWLGDTLLDERTVHTLVAALGRTIQELCLIILWVLSVTACVCWIFYTIAAIWEITLPCSTSRSGAVPDPATDGTAIDLESQAGCTIQATELYAGDVVHVRNNTESPGIGEDTVGSGDSCAAPSKPQETKPQPQAEQVSQLIWSADHGISTSQSSEPAVYTPSTSPYSGPRNPFDGCGQSSSALTTTETIVVADVMIQHLKSCSWVQSFGETWHDMEACERRSSRITSENEPAKNASGAQQPIARAHVVQTTSKFRIENTLKNTLEKGLQNKSTATANIITKATGKVGTGTASGPSIGVVRSATGLFDNRTKSPCSSFAQHRFPNLPNGVNSNGRGRALTDPFKEYYANTTSHKDEQHIMSPLREKKDTQDSFPPNPTSTTPNPSQANRTMNQETQASPSPSSSTPASISAHSPPTSTAVSRPSHSPYIYNAHPAPPPPRPSPLFPSRIIAWETHVLAQEQKRYSQRVRFALETQYRHLRHSDLQTDLQAALFKYSKKNREGKRGPLLEKRSAGVGERGAERDMDFGVCWSWWEREEEKVG